MWTPFNFFIGLWKGSGQGKPGHSRVERKYEFVLNDKFLFVQNKSIYDPQDKNPNGEIHEDRGLISYDRARETYVFRQFISKVLSITTFSMSSQKTVKPFALLPRGSRIYLLAG